MPKRDTLLELVSRYCHSSPIDAAVFIETLDDHAAISVLKALAPEITLKVIKSLPETTAASYMEHFDDHLIEYIAGRLSPEQTSIILRQLSEDKRKRFFHSLTEKKKKDIEQLLQYPEDSAGKIMSTDVTSFHKEAKVKDVIQKIRHQSANKHQMSYLYVIDHETRLIGIVSAYNLMLANPQSTLEEIMHTEVFTVNCFTDREIIANEVSKRKYFAIPVVDNDNRLLGVIKAEKLIKGVQEEATEDILKMFGAGGDERVSSSIWFSLKKRLPWLHVNLATAFLAAMVVSMFEGVIAKITVLAVYLAVVAGQGGNAGAQSLAVVMRGLIMREIPASRVKHLILKETYIGLINGVIIGIVTAIIAFLWQGNPFLGVVIGLGMIVNLVVAGFAGAAIPITMKALRLDPAQCSNIILTTVTDVLGFFAFLSFAVIFQNFLV